MKKLRQSEVREEFKRRLEWARVKRIKLVEKRTSRFMKLIFVVSFMWIWNRRFMTDFTTTIGSTIYKPHLNTFKGTPYDLALLNHEAKHVLDSRKWWIFWGPLYLFPQCLALLAPLGLLWWPLWGFAIFLGPWPAPFRVWAETRGYGQTLATYDFVGIEAHSEHLKENFVGWAYWKMAWRWKPVKKKLEFCREKALGDMVLPDD